MSIRGQAYIAGIYEHPTRKATDKSVAQLHAESALGALRDWGLSASDAGRLFGVSRQALSKWLAQGLPADRMLAVADLAAATDLLVHYLKTDRVPAAVRRKSARLVT